MLRTLRSSRKISQLQLQLTVFQESWRQREQPKSSVGLPHYLQAGGVAASAGSTKQLVASSLGLRHKNTGQQRLSVLVASGILPTGPA